MKFRERLFHIHAAFALWIARNPVWAAWTFYAVFIVLIIGVVALSGCAYRPIVDPTKTDMAKFEQDLADCRQISEAAPGPGTGAAVVGGVWAVPLPGTQPSGRWCGIA